MFCKFCGKEISDEALACPNCGQPMSPRASGGVSQREWLTALLLCFFLGSIGAHSFYAGKTTIGILQIITLGGCGVWTIIDFINLITRTYTDVDGKYIVR